MQRIDSRPPSLLHAFHLAQDKIISEAATDGGRIQDSRGLREHAAASIAAAADWLESGLAAAAGATGPSGRDKAAGGTSSAAPKGLAAGPGLGGFHKPFAPSGGAGGGAYGLAGGEDEPGGGEDEEPGGKGYHDAEETEDVVYQFEVKEDKVCL
jgi:hypothetical protein